MLKRLEASSKMIKPTAWSMHRYVKSFKAFILISSSSDPSFLLFGTSPLPLVMLPAKEEGMKMFRLVEFLGVWPIRFWRARCLAEGLGESRNWKSSVREAIMGTYR